MSEKGAVFDPITVARLWRYQFGPWREPFEPVTDKNAHLPPHMHPFTCGNRDDHPTIAGDQGVLVPTTRGWICPICDYTQTWAHDFMKYGPTDPAPEAPPKVRTPNPPVNRKAPSNERLRRMVERRFGKGNSGVCSQPRRLLAWRVGSERKG